MRVAVVKETFANESRVALVPESVKKLVGLKAVVSVESGAGLDAGATDDSYISAGAVVSADRAALLESADLLVSVNRPAEDDLARLKRGAVVLGFLRPLDEP